MLMNAALPVHQSNTHTDLAVGRETYLPLLLPHLLLLLQVI
jgi:hypothetical protein